MRPLDELELTIIVAPPGFGPRVVLQGTPEALRRIRVDVGDDDAGEVDPAPLHPLAESARDRGRRMKDGP